jgi:hypothetical protein
MKLSELMQDRSLVNRHTVPVLLSTDAAFRVARARDAVDKAQRRLDRARVAEKGRMHAPMTVEATGDLETAQDELVQAEAEAEQHLIDFVVESLGSDEWEALVAAHESPADQMERLGSDDPGYDLKTFPLAAVAACLKEPEVDSLDDVKTLKGKIPDIVWSQLFAAVLRVNRGANAVPPTLLGSKKTRSSGSGSAPASS